MVYIAVINQSKIHNHNQDLCVDTTEYATVELLTGPIAVQSMWVI